MALRNLRRIPVAKSLSASGFQDPTSESSKASQLLTDKFGQGDVQLLITVTGDTAGVHGAAGQAVGTDIVEQLKRSPHVATVTSRVDRRRRRRRNELISKDGRAGLIVAGITGAESEQQKLRQGAVRAGGPRPRRRHRALGGVAMVNVQITEQSQRDLLLMESIAIPLSFLVLVWVFGGLLAAGAAGGGRRSWRSWVRWRYCGRSPSRPTCRSLRST